MQNKNSDFSLLIPVTRALAQAPHASVHLVAQVNLQNQNKQRLEIQQNSGSCAVGLADLSALLAAFSDQKISENFIARADKYALPLMLAEYVRVEFITPYLQGVREHLDEWWAEKLLDVYQEDSRQSKEQVLFWSVAFLLRAVGLERLVPKNLEAEIQYWQKFLARFLPLDDLREVFLYANEQELFLQKILEIWQKIPLSELEGEKKSAENFAQGNQQEMVDDSPASDNSAANVVPEAGSEEQNKAEKHALDDQELSAAFGAQDDVMNAKAASLDLGSMLHGEGETYKIFTRQFDEKISAFALASRDELIRLRAQLDKRLENVREATRRDAHHFLRKLMARRVRFWQSNMEEGQIDSRLLAQKIIDPTFLYYFRQEKEQILQDTTVTLLLDNSGSMRGRPITVAAMCADLLAKTLERCQISVEILGFTSVDWKGGKSRALWTKMGAKANPGRLNDLRHIIYKPAEMPWRRARHALGLMLKDGLLKENLDGEALEWAYGRLILRPEKRKILLVISDGAPVDDSTISANSAAYLERHLRAVISAIENQTDVELLAIGIGHDVGRYYARAITIRDVEKLGKTMFSALSELLTK
jgi:cobaltochelatase CobT